MKQKKLSKYFFLILPLFFSFFLILPSKLVIASAGVCAIQKPVLGINPKSGPANGTFTISGTIVIEDLISGSSAAFNGYCWYPGTDTIVRQLYVTVYDKNTGQKLLSDIALPIQRGNKNLSLPAWSFTPKNSGYNEADLSVAALVKVNQIDTNNWINLGESDPVQVAVTPGSSEPASPPGPKDGDAKGGGVIDCTKTQDPNNCLYNPLPVDDLTGTLLLLMQGFLAIVGVWAVAFIIIGGFRMVISQGDEEALTAAKKTITWAVIGLALALLSFSIVAIVQNFLQADIKDVNVNGKTGTSSGIIRTL